ncbi:EF-hand calcium-binding domain-containing protein 5 [Echinococcus granulosus]|uniref:EF hand calcium binding domain containing protein n=1 Tax=Echinococcus granulosus TaxID=6210 RepID=A0A068WBN6_ECHGR|nr:EF-hand calcium-binding domain-containing protein 5 [Echinococcus granulosus]CDS15096.1 EF hand calcium binding domain containing protein [Echinococcus granulosus]
MGDHDRCARKTVDELAKGFPFSQRFHTHGEEPRSQLQPPQIHIHTTALRERLYNEELFLVRLLSYQREDRRRIKEALVDHVEWLLQRIPIDILSYQWLQNCTISAEVRAFLAEHLIPTLILGLEHILREADQRGLCKLAGDETSEEEATFVQVGVNFNPINRLAEFLMRNNPRYDNLTGNICLTPYARGMRQVLELLKQDLFLKSDTELAKFTAAAEKRKLDLEVLKEQEERKLDEKRRRLDPVFDCFRLEGQKTVNAVIVQKSIRSFLHIAMNLPEDLLLIERPLVHAEPVNENVESYYVMALVRPLSMETFEALVDHMQRCAREYREHVDQRLKLDVLAEVAISCDKDANKDTDQEQLIEAFEKFARASGAEIQQNLLYPHEWRIHEYHLRHAKFDPWDKSVKILPYQPSTRFKDVKPFHGSTTAAVENQTNNS